MSTFTVIVCTYNRADIVKGAIDAILDQTFEDFELLVVNDGSTDDTQAVLESFDDPRFRPITRPNGGLSAARNTGLSEATGDWVIYLDDDDRPKPRWLEVLAQGSGEGVGLITCGCDYIDPDGNLLTVRHPETHPVFEEVAGVFMPGTFAVRREIYQAVGGYAEAIPTSHQTEVVLRLVPELRRRGLTNTVIDEPLLDIERRKPSDRPLSQPQDLLVGARYLIEHHGPVLAEAPGVLADYHAVAGVSAMQIGRYDEGRHHLRQACRIGGWRPKDVARMALATVPPLARRIWTRHYRMPL